MRSCEVNVNNFNNFFANIWESLSNDLPKTDADPVIYMRGNYPILREFAPTSLEEVKNIINKMKKKYRRTGWSSLKTT